MPRDDVAEPPDRAPAATAGGDLGPGQGGAPPRVFILSDVRLLREGMALLLRQFGTVSVAGSGVLRDLDAALAATQPDAVLLDTTPPDMAEAARAIRTASPRAKIVVFALADLDRHAVACAEAGASAFVGRDATAQEIVQAILQAQHGEFVTSARLTSRLIERLAELHGRILPGLQAIGGLTPREREIVPFIERGLSNKEIARELNIEVSTIKNHVHNILDKLQLRRRGEVAGRRLG